MTKLLSRSLRAAALLFTAGLLAGCNQENTTMISFVNMDKLLAESGLLAQEQAHMEQVKASLEQGIKLAEVRYSGMKKEQADAARASDVQVLNMQWHSEQVMARNIVMKAVQEKATELQQQNKLTAILPVQSTLVIDAKHDITQDLATRLKDQSLTFAALPEVTIKAEEVAEELAKEEVKATPETKVKSQVKAKTTH